MPDLADVQTVPINPCFSENFCKYSYSMKSSIPISCSIRSSIMSYLFNTSSIGKSLSYTTESLNWPLCIYDYVKLSCIFKFICFFQLAAFSIVSLSEMSATTRTPEAPLQNNLLAPAEQISCPPTSQSYILISLPSISSTFIEKSQAIVALYWFLN